MPIAQKDVVLHIAGIEHPHEAAEALVEKLAETVASIASKKDVADIAEDLRRNAQALGAAILWGTKYQGTMAPPAPVEPPWTDAPTVSSPANPNVEAVPGMAGHLEVDPAIGEATGEAAAAPAAPPEDTADEGDEGDYEDDEHDQAENGPVDDHARHPRRKKKRR